MRLLISRKLKGTKLGKITRLLNTEINTVDLKIIEKNSHEILLIFYNDVQQ